MTAALRVGHAFVKRDLRVLRTYRLALLGQFLGPLVAVVSTKFLAEIVPDQQVSLDEYGNRYYLFAVLGAGVFACFSIGVGGFAAGVAREQAQGTLDVLLTSPHDTRLLAAAGAVWPFTMAVVQLAVFLAVGAIFFDASIPLANLPLVGAAMLVGLIPFTAIGLLVAAAQVAVKRTTALLGLLTAAFTLLGGVLYPIEVLPAWLRTVADALPLRHAVDAVRYAATDPPRMGPLGRELAIVAGSGLVLLTIAVLVTGWVIDRARARGTIGMY